MAEVLEATMIIAFGVSWPVNVYKSVRTKSTKGKSLLFLLLIELGYVSGIAGKVIADNITWVFIFYVLNFVMVLADVIVYCINKRRENKQQQDAMQNTEIQ